MRNAVIYKGNNVFIQNALNHFVTEEFSTRHDKSIFLLELNHFSSLSELVTYLKSIDMMYHHASVITMSSRPQNIPVPSRSADIDLSLQSWKHKINTIVTSANSTTASLIRHCESLLERTMFSKTEKSVIRAIQIAGNNLKFISRLTYLSPKTVYGYISGIKKKLGFKTTPQLVNYLRNETFIGHP